MRTSDNPITQGKINILGEEIRQAKMRKEPINHLIEAYEHICKECFFADKLRDEQELKDKNT